MLVAIGIVLAVLWLFGLIAAVTFHGLIHLLLVLAIVTILFHFIRGRRPVVRP